MWYFCRGTFSLQSCNTVRAHTDTNTTPMILKNYSILERLAYQTSLLAPSVPPLHTAAKLIFPKHQFSSATPKPSFLTSCCLKTSPACFCLVLKALYGIDHPKCSPLFCFFYHQLRVLDNLSKKPLPNPHRCFPCLLSPLSYSSHVLRSGDKVNCHLLRSGVKG